MSFDKAPVLGSSPARCEICLTVNGVPLHTCHYNPPVVLIWLKYCRKGRKIASHSSIHSIELSKCCEINLFWWLSTRQWTAIPPRSTAIYDRIVSLSFTVTGHTVSLQSTGWVESLQITKQCGDRQLFQTVHLPFFLLRHWPSCPVIAP